MGCQIHTLIHFTVDEVRRAHFFGFDYAAGTEIGLQ